MPTSAAPTSRAARRAIAAPSARTLAPLLHRARRRRARGAARPRRRAPGCDPPAMRERCALSSGERGGERGRRRPVKPRGALRPGLAVCAAGSRPGSARRPSSRSAARPASARRARGRARRRTGVSTRGHPVEVPGLEIPDARRPEVRGQVGPGAQDQPHVGRTRSRGATPRAVALQHQRGHRVIGHRGEPDPLEPLAAERAAEQRRHVLPLEALQGASPWSTPAPPPDRCARGGPDRSR